LKNNNQRKSAKLHWVFRAMLIVPLALGNQVAFSADDMATESATSACAFPTFTVSKEWFRDTLAKIIRDKKIPMSKQAVENLADTYFEMTKSHKVIPAFLLGDKDNAYAYLTKTFPDLAPETSAMLLIDLTSAATQKENDASGRPLGHSEEIDRVYEDLLAEIGKLMLKAAAVKRRSRDTDELEHALDMEDRGTVSRNIFFAFSTGNYKKLLTKAQRRQFSDQGERLLIKNAVADKEVEEAKKCPNLSEFITHPHIPEDSVPMTPETRFPLLKDIITAGK
jgi:hypothetical protein